MLCLGRAVRHTGQIEASAPLEEVRVFGLPKQPPCVMQNALSFGTGPEGAWIRGLAAEHVVLSAGMRARSAADGRVFLEAER